ncbi:hypothetical protein HY490_05020, partial [Candidatus Woesearchaeota archaeon]|nr:hypothetical protein [Candidatus Woesearchaeota archaeon]
SRHLSQTLLLPLLFFFLVFLAVNTVKKGLTISHPVLILWAVGHVVTLLMTANADKRYLIPLLPLVFAFGTRQTAPYLEEKRARTILIWVMIIWHAVFLSRQALSAFSPEVWTFILHIAIYGLIVYVLSGVLRRTLKAITGTLFLLLILSSAIIQLSMTYSFFVYQYDWTTTPNDAVEYLAKHASANATVLTNKRNSLTTPDEHWFTAFRRPDLKTEYNAEAGNKTGILWSTPTSKLETDETGALAKILELTPIATFGERHKKYPLMKISSSTEKRWQQFFDTGTLFMIEESTAYKVILYKEE